MSPRRRIALSALALLTSGAGAPAGAEGALTPYEVRAGDTLYQLARRYLESPEDWRALARLNRVSDPKRLPVGATLMVPTERLRGVARQATVLYLKGLVVADPPARELKVGDELAEGTALRVHEGAFLGLGLADGSTLHLPARTQLRLERLRQADGLGGAQNSLRLERGRVDSRVHPQPAGSRFDVRTPLALTGVRGTRFGVALSEDGARAFTDVIDGRVAVAAGERSEAPVALEAGQGAVVDATAPAPRVLPLLPAPALGADGLSVQRLPHALALAPLPGAQAYRLQVEALAGEGEALARMLFDAIAPGAPPPLSGLPDGEYRLRLRAIDAEGLMGAEATARLRVKATPIAPLARSPAANALVGVGRVALRCTEVPGAIAYDLQVSRDPRFQDPIAETRQAGRCAFDLPIAEPGALLWRVASVARGADGQPDRGPFGDPNPLTLVPPPAAPAAPEPSDDGQGLHWAGVAGHRYRVQLASDADFRRIVQDVEVEQPSVQLELQACRSYFVRLSSRSPQGLESPFSAPRRVGARTGLCSHDGVPVRSPHGERWDTQPR